MAKSDKNVSYRNVINEKTIKIKIVEKKEKNNSKCRKIFEMFKKKPKAIQYSVKIVIKKLKSKKINSKIYKLKVYKYNCKKYKNKHFL